MMLHLLRPFFCFLLLIGGVQAAQVATVKSSRAVIYSDIDLNSPIGFVSRGKRLFVGKNKRKSKQLLPVIINRMVAWVKVSDLALTEEDEKFSDNKKITEHRSLIIEEELDERLKDPWRENNYLRFKVGLVSPTFSSGEEAQGSGFSITDEEITGYETSLVIEHRHPLKRFNWGIGGSISKHSSENAKYELPLFKFGIGYVMAKFNNFNIEALGYALASMDYRLSVAGIEGEYSGTALGFELGPLLRYRTYHKTSIVASAQLKKVKLINLKGIENGFSDKKDDLSSMQDLSFFIGLSFVI